MANLSNINGKFAVDSTGAIKFNNLTGTNNQVLIANTGASPTWVDVSTIIGGPYLPLTGGTLAGDGNLVVGGTLTVNGATTLNAALTGTTATFSGLVSGITPTAAANFATKAYVDAHPGSGGTVTSVGGTGTVSGITLTGTVTSTGNLTLGGTLSASITNISNAYNWWNNFGQTHGTRTSFDASTASYGFGWRYIQGNTNGPGTGGTQFYSAYVGLGSEYPATGSGSYGAYLAFDRNVTNPYLSIRYNEANALGTWKKISAGTADILTTARTIAGVSFDGSANISLNNNAITNGAGYTTNTGNGTVTSVATGNGLSGGTITSTGTLTMSGTYSGNFNFSTNNVVVGGNFTNNPYNSTSGARLMFGSGDSNSIANYYIGTNLEDFGGNYTKLSLAWHTGIKIGAQSQYGGVRFYDDEDFSNVILNIGVSNTNVGVVNELTVGGNVGIGTNGPSEKLHVNGSTYMIGGVATLASSAVGLRVSNPGGASVATQNSTVTGAIKIILPSNFSNTMMKMTVKVYEYTTNESFVANIAGYNHSSQNWYNISADITSNANTDRNFTVRYGYDGTNCVIYIGELNSTWSYPQVFVTDFQAGFSNYTVDRWVDGWTIGYEASAFQGTIFSVSNCQVTNWARNGQNVYYASGSGNVGIGTTSPGNKLTIASGTGGGSAPDSRTLLHIDKDGEAYISINSPAESFNGIRLNVAGTPKAFMELYDNTAQGKKLNIGTVDARDLVFDTGNQPKMTILAGGNVGIGTTSPVAKLHIQGGDIGLTTGQKIGWLYNPTAATPNNNMYNYILTDNNGGVPASPLEISGSRWTNGNTRGIIFTHQTGGEIMTIMTGGNVGIGTTAPEHKLVAIGTIGFGLNYNGGVYVNNTITSVDENWGLEVQRTANVDDYNTRLKYYPVSGQSRAAGIYDSRNARFSLYSDTNNNPNIIIPNGNVGINNTSPGQKLSVVGDGSGTSDVVRITHGNGSHTGNGLSIRSANTGKPIYVDGSVGAGFAEITTAYNANPNIRTSGDVVAYASSDKRFKDNLEVIQNPIDKIHKLNGYTFDWNDKQDVYKGKDYGVVAQEVEKVMPELVDTRFDGYKAVKYEKLVPLLIESIKELEARVKELENK